jgi:arylsulfatase
MKTTTRQNLLVAVLISAMAFTTTIGAQAADAKKPNILILWGDDIGWWNISAYNHGQMGYKTPNIDRIEKEGVAFTDYFAQQSCTAGRAALINVSAPVRSGMTKVGMPAAKEGWQTLVF